MRAYLLLSGAVFAAQALLHLLRLALRWPAAIAGLAVPVWLSALALLVTGGLAGWAFRLAAKPAGALGAGAPRRRAV